jgi:hypothetical protein
MKIVFAFLLACLALPCHAGKLAGPMYKPRPISDGFTVYPTKYYFYGAVAVTLVLEALHNLAPCRKSNPSRRKN